MGRLDWKVALVMGGASPNIGGTTAHFLAREGAKVVVNDMRQEAIDEALEFLTSRGYEAAGFVGDAADEEQVREIAQRTVQRFGRIDVLFNSAGWHYWAPVLDTDIGQWNEQFRRNLTAAMVTTKEVGRVMVGQGTGGAMVHVASDAGHQGEPGSAGYSAVKAGVLNFCRAAAMDLAQFGIRVNTVSPTFNEHLLDRVRTRPGDGERGPYTRTPDDFLQGIPLGRFCRAEDVANAVVFLSSEEASFITGFDVPLVGGALQKYWPWQPGYYTGITVEKLAQTRRPSRFGELSTREG